MGVLIDTNVLLRRVQPDHPNHAAAVGSIAKIIADGEMLFFTPQNIAEFWNVATRPIASNGLGLPPLSVLEEVGKIESFLTLLPDDPATYVEWKRLITQHAVSGVKVHDARLVAAMNVRGIDRLLIFDAKDFVRYGIDIVDPYSLIV